MTTLTTPLLDDWCYLSRRLPADEQAHFAALTGCPAEPEVVARAWANTAGPTWCLLGDDGLPLVGGGFEPLRPGVYRAWLACTDGVWATHGRAITRHCRRFLKALLATDAHRVEITTLHERTKACRWYLVGLKMCFEGLHHRGAADGRDTVTYALTKGAP